MSEDVVRQTFQRGDISSDRFRENIDRDAKSVSVTYLDDMPPRIAVYRPYLGCTQLPIGASMDAAAGLRRLTGDLSAPGFDQSDWPMGDKNAIRRLPRSERNALEAVMDEAFRDQEGAYTGNTWGIVVIKDGKIVSERYVEGFGPHISARTNSMCKSLGISLVGIGVQKGLVDIHGKAPLEAWRTPGDPRGEITLNDMLHMASGMYTQGSGNPQGDIYGSGAPPSEISALNMMDAKPGERFVYAGSDTILSVRAVREALDDDEAFISFPHRELMWKIGMTRTVVETDWRNDFLASGQCWSTARDFGRFGLLYLNDGMWNGERILPAGWADYVSELAPAQPGSYLAGTGAGYGAQFWVYDGREGLPKAYSAAGALGQYAMIVPSENLVVVRRGLDRGQGFNIAKFTADVIKALE
ncbi:MAG: serine hydrolase [Hyphomonadaceae bacterium]